MKYKRYSIVILPSSAVAKKAIATSTSLKKLGGVFSLNKKDHFPHITLYMVEFPVKNLSKIKNAVIELSKTLQPFSVQSLKNRHVYDGYIDVVYKHDRNISDLQKQIIAALNLLREDHLRKKDRTRLSEMPAIERKNIERYGYYAVGKNFFPHLTFTKFPKKNPDILKELKSADFSFNVRELALCEVGDFGTCKKILKKFRLK